MKNKGWFVSDEIFYLKNNYEWEIEFSGGHYNLWKYDNLIHSFKSLSDAKKVADIIEKDCEK